MSPIGRMVPQLHFNRATLRVSLIQQTINLTVSGSQETTIWHPAPTSPTDYGEAGWMAYDGDYQYIYAGGRWLRQSIAEWTA